MAHYYDTNPSIASKEKKISFEIYGKTITLLTDNGVFSKSKVDEGSLIFLKSLIPLNLSGKILDLGAGYGTIGLTLALFNETASLTLAEINTRALALCEKNAKLLGVNDRVTCLHSDVYSNVEGPYNSIVINPPIRAGKNVTFEMYRGARERLIDGGRLFIVIRKDQGAESASKYIKELFGNITLLERKKGYLVFMSEKTQENN
jgi:16S rRNA (guanine1207-N2)-methyltransferase